MYSLDAPGRLPGASNEYMYIQHMIVLQKLGNYVNILFSVKVDLFWAMVKKCIFYIDM